MKSNVTAAIVGRLSPLLLRSKGSMFNCQIFFSCRESTVQAPDDP